MQCKLHPTIFGHLFDKGLAYRTIGCHRSAISAFHEKVDGLPIGQHPDVCSLVSGVFNSRPPQPRYVFIWDVQLVLNLIKNQWSNNHNLSDKQITYKIVMLMALTSASRASALHHLDVRYMTRSADRYSFTFHKLHKSWGAGKAPPKLEFFKYDTDTDLCVVHTLDAYILRAQEWRTANNKTQLLLSHIKPHCEIKSCTVSRWIKEILTEAGIDTELFKGHSTRSASTSKVGVSGLSTADILSRGSWTNESTWQRFYNKPITSAHKKFQSSVLDKGTL